MTRTLADPRDMAQWMWDASEKLNYPSAQKLYQYLKANNQYVPLEVIEKSFTLPTGTTTFFFAPETRGIPDTQDLSSSLLRISGKVGLQQVTCTTDGWRIWRICPRNPAAAATLHISAFWWS